MTSSTHAQARADVVTSEETDLAHDGQEMRLLGRSFPPSHRFTPRTVHLRASEVQEGFFLALRAAGRAEGTLEWYKPRLASLAAAVHDAPASEISAAGVRAWLVSIKERGTLDSYVESYRRAAAAMFSWAVREGILARSPMTNVAKVRHDVRETIFPTLEEIHQLLATQPASDPVGIRNRATLVLLYDTGMRISELTRIELRDVDLEAGEILLRRTKARRERRVPILPRTRALLWHYVKHARPLPLFAESDRLFLSRRARALTPHAVEQWMRRAAIAASVDVRKVHPHAFRHAFITEALRAGMNESTVMQITGIKTPSVLRRYTHLVDGDVRKPHASLSPAARLAV